MVADCVIRIISTGSLLWKSLETKRQRPASQSRQRDWQQCKNSAWGRVSSLLPRPRLDSPKPLKGQGRDSLIDRTWRHKTSRPCTSWTPQRPGTNRQVKTITCLQQDARGRLCQWKIELDLSNKNPMNQKKSEIRAFNYNWCMKICRNFVQIQFLAIIYELLGSLEIQLICTAILAIYFTVRILQSGCPLLDTGCLR